MGRGVPARQRLARMPLSTQLVQRALMAVWPRRNRFDTTNLEELLAEAKHFGVRTYGAYLRVLRRHRRAIVRMDQGPLDLTNQRIYAKEYGQAYVSDRQRRRYFYSVEGLTRSAFELEFGDAYEDYCRRYRATSESAHAI